MRKIFLVVISIYVFVVLTACSGDPVARYSSSLSMDHYCNIGTVHNVFSYSPEICSDENNIGDVYIRILDSKGKIIGTEIKVEPGCKTVISDIPALSGTCTIQGKAENIDGAYTFFVEWDH